MNLADGRLTVGQVRIGKRVFVGNSGMVGLGRKLPKGSLVGVLSAASRKAMAAWSMWRCLAMFRSRAACRVRMLRPE